VLWFHKHIEPFRAAGVTVILIDHQSKPQKGQDYKHKTTFGSVYKGNLARSVVQVEPRRREDGMLTVVLRHKKHNFGQLVAPMGAKITFSEQSVIVEAVEPTPGDFEGGKEPIAIDKVRQALKDGPGYPHELAERTKTLGEKPLQVKTVQNKITDLKNWGEVETTGKRKGQAEQVRLVSPSPSTIRDRDRDATVEDQEASV
jgi:hypothetical protein